MNLATMVISPVFPVPLIALLAIVLIAGTVLVYGRVSAGCSKPQQPWSVPGW